MSTPTPCWTAAAVVALALVACSTDDDNPPNSNGPTDSGEVEPDAGFEPDAGEEDAGEATTCDPIGLTGCTGTDQCVWVVTNNVVQCRDVGAANAIGAACTAALTDCEAGATCVNLGGTGDLCYKVCRQDSGNADCDALPGDNLCVGIADSSEEFGVCVAVTSCDPLDDMCEADEVCSLFQGDLTCQPAGDVPRGGDCAARNCMRGSICVTLQTAGSVCYEPCDPTNAGSCTTPDTRCQGLVDLDFGVCVPFVACDPLNDTCPATERCTLVGGGLAECRPAGNVPRGGDCSMMSCQRGSVCVAASGGPATCYQPCNGSTTCAMGSCSTNLQGYDFGICL